MTLQELNENIAINLTKGVSTMWCAYAFAILACVSLPEAIKGGIGTLIIWVDQTFIQLVLLSVIMVGQGSLGKDNEKLVNQMAKDIRADLECANDQLSIAKQERDEIHKSIKQGKEDRDRMETVLTELARSLNRRNRNAADWKR